MNALANILIITNELSYRNNQITGTQFTVQPQFRREIGVTDNEHFFTRLRVEIKNTKENPFPVDVVADITGVFETKNFAPDQLEEFQKHQAISILLPYIRNMISSVTANALVQPIVMPILDVYDIFPD